MRSKRFLLGVICAIILVGCSTGSPTPEATERQAITTATEVATSTSPLAPTVDRTQAAQDRISQRETQRAARTQSGTGGNTRSTPDPNEGGGLQDTELIPLTDMGTATYQGLEGGLYPGGSNEVPEEHAREGLARARMIQPLDKDGHPSASGKYVFISIGMSNTMMEFCGQYTDNVNCQPYSFVGISSNDSEVNHEQLFFVNGARGAQVADRWEDVNARGYDFIRDRALIPRGYSELQVQVVWLKVANFGVTSRPSLPSDRADAYLLMENMGQIIRTLKQRYPNLQQVFISSRIYAGYATVGLNPEPYAYETGYAVKWLIQAQIDQMASGGEVYDPRVGDLNYSTVAPWIAWGPYLWAAGETPRSDGFFWMPEDFSTQDGTHPSELGREKVARLLLEFFKTSPFTQCWFLVTPSENACAPIAGNFTGGTPVVTSTPVSENTQTFSGDDLVPLTEMGSDLYFGFEGGLYPGGSNQIPAEHAAEGMDRARAIQPLDEEGQPDPSGKYVFLSVGMSNTTMEFCRALGSYHKTDGISCYPYSFMGMSAADPSVDHSQLFLLNGARGAQPAEVWASSSAEIYDRIRDELMAPLGLSEEQVQIVWLKVADPLDGGEPSLPSDQADAYLLLEYLGDIIRALHLRYPNLQQVFISSRIYAGYANREINPEPYAYESGFAVKWLIESQIEQMDLGDSAINPIVGDLNYETVAPWIAWGPYLWASGSNPRSDGLVWLPGDFGNDGTHPSAAGREKVAELLLDFFKTTPVTQCWFLADSDC
jgi:lysophospholipase L1-like esterase